jgi:hypothetical protein
VKHGGDFPRTLRQINGHLFHFRSRHLGKAEQIFDHLPHVTARRADAIENVPARIVEGIPVIFLENGGKAIDVSQWGP